MRSFRTRQPPASPGPRCRGRRPPQYRSSLRISRSARDRSGPGSGTGRSTTLRRAGRARPSSISPRRRDRGIAVIRATGRPRSVMVTVSPAAASATTADAFCLSARIPTSDMCFNVAHVNGSTTVMTPRSTVHNSPSPWPSPRSQRGSSVQVAVGCGQLHPLALQFWSFRESGPN